MGKAAWRGVGAGRIKTIKTVRKDSQEPSITKEDLADPYCNFCMEAGNNGKNEVLVVSPLLEEYIRKNYSSYTINSSTCKEIRSVAALNEEGTGFCFPAGRVRFVSAALSWVPIKR